ncbi:MAG: Thiamine biosynthesis protein ThiS [Candidatus Magnetoglobus multicellularis str. Araruama]|uniref:Thiamine biosynthesis protein ThiS n=1 Tax=Candidatus Magnetoglobus multicellularis str. Araruama TaxID=890399 RepID=A0A1V1PE50_9BACT|nr:MAG: Thiamine biosynthesis protein ThiS [Candidatus Magnetoglobus multicellularis str. Araruama]
MEIYYKNNYYKERFQMIVAINGEKVSFIDPITIASFLASKCIQPDTVVVEHNKIIVPSEDYQTTWLNHQDNLEILRFVGGG